MGRVLAFSRSAPEVRDWRNDELAELYRVENSLLQAGVCVSTARGLTDEGDPWFAFCGASGEVIVHIARFDGAYHIHAAALEEGLSGQSFTEITKRFIGRLPMQMSKGVTLHPSALFGLMVATLFFAVDHKPAEAATKLAPEAAHHAAPASLVNSLRHYVRALADKTGETAFASDGEMEAMTSLIAVAATLGGTAEALHIGSSSSVAPTADTIALADPAPSLQAADAFASPPPSEAGYEAPTGAGALAPANSAPSATAPLATATSAATAPASSAAALPARAPISAAAPPPAPVALGVTVASHVDSGETVLVANSGSLSLVENLGAGAFKIVVASNAHVSLDLAVSATKSASSGEATLVLGGHASLDLTDLTAMIGTATAPASASASASAPLGAALPTTPDAPTLSLSVASAGAGDNTLTLGDSVGSSVNLAIHVTGSQDLHLNESAANLAGVSVDSTGFAGALTIGVDLSNVSGGATVIGQSSFVVSEHSSLALLNVGNNATVQFGINLASAIVDMNAGATALDLQLTPTSGGVSVTSLSASGVSNMTMESLGGPGQANAVEALYGSALQTLALVGDAPLTIGAFVMSQTGGQPEATIDASHFGARLVIDVTGLAASHGDGAGLTIKLGGAGSEVTDTDTTSAFTIFSGGGADTINLGAGATRVALVNPTASEQIVIGGGTTTDTVVDATHVAQASAPATLVGAAEAAAAGVAATGAHQAVVFNYAGAAYVFVDALGNHVFNASTDAIVGLVGAYAPAETVAHFHSV